MRVLCARCFPTTSSKIVRQILTAAAGSTSLSLRPLTNWAHQAVGILPDGIVIGGDFLRPRGVSVLRRLECSNRRFSFARVTCEQLLNFSPHWRRSACETLSQFNADRERVVGREVGLDSSQLNLRPGETFGMRSL